MSQDNKKSFVMYQGDGSNNVFSVPMTKGKYGTISVAFVRRGLDQYEYNPDTWGLNGGLFAWDLSGVKVYTDTATPAIGATIYDQYGVDTGDTVTAVGGATITVNTNVYTRDTLHDVDENTVLSWTGDVLQIGDYIVIERTTTRTQPFEFQNNQKHIEKSDDNLERQIQEVADKVDNALLVDPTHVIDSNKMNPVEWMETILRSVDKSVRAFRYLNGWLDYSLDDPNIADADKTWVHLLNTDNIKAIRERSEIVDNETVYWTEYQASDGTWKILANTSEWDRKIQYAVDTADEAKSVADDAKDIAQDASDKVDGFDARITANANSIIAINQELDTFGNIVTHNANEFATEAQGAKADSAIQPNDNVSELNNDAKYQTDTQVSSSISTHNTSTTAHSDIRNAISSKQDQLTAGTNVDITDNVISATDTKYTAGNGLTLTGTTFSANVIDTTTSDSTINALSARVGKILQEQINNLNTRGKYLSIWNCTTGLAMDEPPVDPYTYETGSFFIVGVVAGTGGTNYKPSGSTYSSSTPSTVVETEPVKPNDTYYYDGTTWRLLATQGGGTVAFSSLLGSPYDNTNLSNALNAKQATLVSGTNIKTVNSTSLLGNGNIDVQPTITGGATSITSSNLTTNRALISSASGKVAVSDITSTELGYLDGVTSAIQTQLDNKSTVSGSATGTATDEVKYITIDGVEKKLAGGSGRNIGDIFYTTRTDTGLNGAVECNGGTYNTEDYEGDGSIGELLEAGKVPYVSLSQYATLLSTNGACGVFGWDGTGTTTFRVPTLQDVFVECGKASELGDYIGAGLPNVSGKFIAKSNNGGASGAFSSTFLNTDRGYNGNWHNYEFNFDASRSNAIYGNSDTVQPEAVKYRAMIQLFNSTTDEAVATVGTVVADVAELKDMSNITPTGKETVVGWGMPDYTSGTSLSLTAGQTYTATYNQMICVVISWGTSGASEVLIRTSNDTSSASNIIFGGRGSNYNWGAYHLYLKKGQSFYIQTLSGVYSFTAYPIIGG